MRRTRQGLVCGNKRTVENSLPVQRSRSLRRAKQELRNGQPNKDVEREESGNVSQHRGGDDLAKCNAEGCRCTGGVDADLMVDETNPTSAVAWQGFHILGCT